MNLVVFVKLLAHLVFLGEWNYSESNGQMQMHLHILE